MILNLYKDALQIIKNNKAFILLYFLAFLSSIPESGEFRFSLSYICRSAPVTLFLTLCLELYVIGIVYKYKKPTQAVDPPSKLLRKYFWKSLLVGVVSLFWIFIVLGLPYVLIGVVLDLISGILLWSVNFIWCIVLSILTFGLFNLGVIILVTKKSLPLESPARGLLELYGNFRYYFKIYLSTVVFSYTPVIVAVIYTVLRKGLDFLSPSAAFSFNPNQSAYGLIFDSDAKLIFFFIFIGMYMIQKVVMTLSYFDRPDLAENKIIKSATV